MLKRVFELLDFEPVGKWEPAPVLVLKELLERVDLFSLEVVNRGLDDLVADKLVERDLRRLSGA